MPAPCATATPPSTSPATRLIHDERQRIDGITVPARLTATDQQRAELRQWLWRVVIADGTRAFTVLDRWRDALRHIEQHRGIDRRTFDGRQTALLAAATTGGHPTALALLQETEPGDPWEETVTAALTALCRPGEQQAAAHAADLWTALEPAARLALAVLDATDPAPRPPETSPGPPSLERVNPATATPCVTSPPIPPSTASWTKIKEPPSNRSSPPARWAAEASPRAPASSWMSRWAAPPGCSKTPRSTQARPEATHLNDGRPILEHRTSGHSRRAPNTP
ncbi:hypothetical protein ACFY00_33985 [Kitasatospora sp. NPDC001540]|uniref:hypothetical protein n=1 Tax=Kitasatospora sp. NPDC001540 TaxID=3364014 RepID=UPI003697D1B4